MLKLLSLLNKQRLKQEYPAVISVLPEGAYHIYDYQFFFMNLQENVKHRVELYMEQAAATEQAA